MTTNQQRIEARAPGKVILHGEHAVVYGNKAIAVSVGLYTVIKIEPCLNSKVSVKFSDVFINSSFTLEQLRKLKASFGPNFSYDTLVGQSQIPILDNVKEQLKIFVEEEINLNDCKEELRGAQFSALQAFLFVYLAIFDELVSLDCSIDTELPVGAGLGSSASFAVALAGGLLLRANRIDSTNNNLELVNQWAYVSEQFVHGNPSGVDNSVATFGGAVLFQKGHDLQCLKTPEIHALLVNTKVPRSTKILVEMVAKLRTEDPDYFQTLLDDVTFIVEDAVERMKNNQELSSTQIERNQNILSKMNVSHPKLDLIVDIAKKYSVPAKLTGAGGGGCAFILLPSNMDVSALESLKSSLAEQDFQFWDTLLGAKGFHAN